VGSNPAWGAFYGGILTNYLTLIFDHAWLVFWSAHV